MKKMPRIDKIIEKYKNGKEEPDMVQGSVQEWNSKNIHVVIDSSRDSKAVYFGNRALKKIASEASQSGDRELIVFRYQNEDGYETEATISYLDFVDMKKTTIFFAYYGYYRTTSKHFCIRFNR